MGFMHFYSSDVSGGLAVFTVFASSLFLRVSWTMLLESLQVRMKQRAYTVLKEVLLQLPYCCNNILFLEKLKEDVKGLYSVHPPTPFPPTWPKYVFEQ